VRVASPGAQEGVPLVGTTPEKLTVPPAGVLEGATVTLAPAGEAGAATNIGAIAPLTTARAMATPARRN